jgi:hypothetical protein
MFKTTTHRFIQESHIPVLNAVVRAHNNTSTGLMLVGRLYDSAKKVHAGAQSVPGDFIINRYGGATGPVTVVATDERSGLFIQLQGTVGQENLYLSSGKYFSCETQDTMRGHTSSKIWTNP